MNCPKCGALIPEDKVFCPSCGYSVQIVPDFELDIEESIAETRSEMADILDTLIGPDGSRRVSENTIEIPGLREKVRLIRIAAAVLMIAAVLAVLGICGELFLFREKEIPVNSLKLASEAYQRGDYESAVPLYEAASAEEPDWLYTDRMDYADALIQTGNVEKGETIYRDILEVDPQNRQAFEQLIHLYQDNGWYGEINHLILESPDEDLRKEFSGYLTSSPVFSVPGGSYEDEFSLEITDSEQGEIYYTLNGSAPTEHSELYTGPIELGEGTTVVTAAFLNRFGMMSDPVSMKYEIHFAVPDPPQVKPKPGTYSQPEYITVSGQSPGVIYYTLDGSVPTEESEIYEDGQQIPMALGKSTLSFLTVSEKGVRSEVTTAVYQLNLTGACSPEDAVNYVAASLVMKGALSDIYGTVPGVDGRYCYFCTHAAREGSRTYYIVEEYFESPGGALSLTGTYYAVDVMSGMMYRARKGPDGRFGYTLFY